MDHQDLADQQDQRDLQEVQEQELARPDRLDLPATPDRRDPMVYLAHLVPLEKMEAR